MESNKNKTAGRTSITPFLVVDDGGKALEFYKMGLGGEQVTCYETPDGRLMAKINIDGAEFWMGDEEKEFSNHSPRTIGGSPVRIILTVADPDTLFAQALKAGAKQICPVTVEESWKIGKLEDPFGHIWEIGHPLPN